MGEFLDITPEAWSVKQTTDRLDFIKMLNFCVVKDNVERMRKQATNCEKMFIKCMSHPGLSSKIYEVLKLNNKKINYLITKWAKDLNRYLTEDTQMASRHVKRLNIVCCRELQFKRTVREFPGGSVVRIRHFHCHCLGSTPGWGNKIPQATQHGPKKQNKTTARYHNYEKGPNPEHWQHLMLVRM